MGDEKQRIIHYAMLYTLINHVPCFLALILCSTDAETHPLSPSLLCPAALLLLGNKYDIPVLLAHANR